MNENSCQMFLKLNQIRVSNKIPPLMISNNCVNAAQSHADDMVKRDYFSHSSPRETFGQRMRRFGLKNHFGENISRAPSFERVIRGWMNSPGHKRNILNPRYKSTGVGNNGKIWVQCFSVSYREYKSHTVQYGKSYLPE